MKNWQDALDTIALALIVFGLLAVVYLWPD